VIKSVAALLGVICLTAPFWPPAAAAEDVNVRLAAVKQERQHVEEVRRRLEAQLGQLGRELQRLDRALVKARAQTREVTARWRKVYDEQQQLKRRQAALQSQIDALRRKMVDESVAAWQQARRQPGWLEVLAGVSVTEVPNRQFMLRYVMQEQQADKDRLQQALAELDVVVTALVAKEQQLAVVRDERRRAEDELEERRAARQQMKAKVRRDVRLQLQRDKELAGQEQALKQLLDGLQLLASDRETTHVPVRKLRGKLPWPLKGRLVAGFGTRPGKGRPKLEGVQIAPRSQRKESRQVRAMAAGQVRYADWFGGFGLMLIVEHGDGIMAIYAHNDALYKQLGDWVEPGEVVAEAGSTGWIDEVRLYFEMRDKGKPVDPARWCRR